MCTSNKKKDNGKGNSKEPKEPFVLFKNSSTKTKARIRIVGRALRVGIFIFNGYAWTVGMLCILGSILIGFYSKTIRISWSLDLYDFSLTTPCTIMFYYGCAIGIATCAGCFAASGGRWWWTATYCILLIFLCIFDATIGISVFLKKRSLIEFLDSIFQTMDKYRLDGTFSMDMLFGVYPVYINEYWDHIQMQSGCCGMFGWQDWVNSTIGKESHLPDSCCNERYRHIDCGKYLVNHPDFLEHSISDVIFTKGCLSVYPRRFIYAFNEASVSGIILGLFLLFSFILSLILFILVITCLYRPGHPITGPISKNRRQSSIDDENDRKRRRSSDKERDKRRSSGTSSGRVDRVRVYPKGVPNSVYELNEKETYKNIQNQNRRASSALPFAPKNEFKEIESRTKRPSLKNETRRSYIT